MKLRNLIFSLFLLIGAIGFTACTGDGDDGAAGPAGPPGEQGPPGEPGADAGDVEYNYPFLANWGKPSGQAACGDDVLTGSGVFPGPDLTPLPRGTVAQQTALASAAAAANPNGYVQVTCTLGGVFAAPDNPDLNGDGTGDLQGYTAEAGPIFLKSHRGSESSVEDMEGSSTAAASQKRTNKAFSGGLILAEMTGTGASAEAFERAQLYHDCGVGTATPNLRGEWRGVRIVETNVNRQKNAATGLVTDVANSDVVTTTTKICVKLDSLPGVTKCYVRVQVVPNSSATAGDGTLASAATASVSETIGIYTADGLTAVMPAARPVGNANAGQLTPNDGTLDEFFVQLDAAGTAAVADFQGVKLCNLFNEARPADS